MRVNTAALPPRKLRGEPFDPLAQVSWIKRTGTVRCWNALVPGDDASARAWLYGKLLVALLVEKLVRHAAAVSPWGCRLPA